jgi:hypothetical protein
LEFGKLGFRYCLWLRNWNLEFNVFLKPEDKNGLGNKESFKPIDTAGRALFFYAY